MTDGPLPPQLAAHDREFAAIAARAQVLVSGLSDAQFNWHPGPGRWSVGDCLAHLIRADGLYLEKISAMIADARARNLTGPGPWRYGWFGNWFARTLEPPAKRRFRTQPVFDIEAGVHRDPAATADAFQGLVTALRRRVAEASGVNLGAVRTTSPATKLLRFSLGACFAILAAHERRHLWQAEQVKADGWTGDCNGGA